VDIARFIAAAFLLQIAVSVAAILVRPVLLFALGTSVLPDIVS
jgi:hypothetical protein